jgi:hypothetical protein
MASVLRPRLDVVVVLAGTRHEFHTTIRDTVTLKGRVKNLAGDMEDATRLAWIACERLGLFAGTWDEFLDAVDDIEFEEPPPLRAAAGSPDSSPQPPGPQG